MFHALMPDADALLKDMSLSIRARVYTSLFTGSADMALLYSLTSSTDTSTPPLQPCGPALTLDIHLARPVDLWFSSHQLQLVQRIAGTKTAYTTRTATTVTTATPTAAAPTPNITPAAVPTYTPLLPKLPDPPNELTSPTPSAVTPTAAMTPGAKRGWMSWMWDLVADDNETAFQEQKQAEEAAFAVIYQLLAPSEEVAVCVNVSEVNLHLTNPRSAPVMPHYGAASGNMNVITSSRMMGITHAGSTLFSSPTHFSSPTSASPPSTRGRWHSHRTHPQHHAYNHTLFASFQCYHVAMRGSFPIGTATVTHRAPSFALDLGSVSLLDRTDTEARPVLICGSDQFVRESFTFITHLPTKPTPPTRTAPCTYIQCLHTDSNETATTATVTSTSAVVPPDAGTVSLDAYTPHGSSHGIQFVDPSHATSPTSTASTGATSTTTAAAPATGTSTSQPQTVALSIYQTYHTRSESHPSGRVDVDICVGSVGLVVDLTSHGTSALVAQAYMFLQLDTGDDVRKHVDDDMFDASDGEVAEINAGMEDATPMMTSPSNADTTTNTTTSSSITPKHLPYAHRIFISDLVAAIRVSDATEWRFDQLYLQNVDTLVLQLDAFKGTSAWEEEQGGDTTAAATPPVTAPPTPTALGTAPEAATPSPSRPRHRFDGISLHQLVVGFRALHYEQDVWRERSKHHREYSYVRTHRTREKQQQWVVQQQKQAELERM